MMEKKKVGLIRGNYLFCLPLCSLYQLASLFSWVLPVNQKRRFRRHFGFSNFPCVGLLTCVAVARYLFFSFAVMFAATQRSAAGSQVLLFRRLVRLLPERRHGCGYSLRFLQEQLPPLQNFVMGQGKFSKSL